MNIIEAIKSGKPFNRPGRDWIAPLHTQTHNWLTLPMGDLIADDWETKEPREFWLVGGYYFNKEQSAVDHLNNIDGPTAGIIHVREILE